MSERSPQQSNVIYPWNMYNRQDKLGISSNLVKAKLRYSPGRPKATLPKYVKNLIHEHFGEIGVTTEQPVTLTVKSPVTTSMVSSLPPGVTAVTRIVHKTTVCMKNIMVFNGADIHSAPPKKHVVTYGVTPTPAIVVTSKIRSKSEKALDNIMQPVKVKPKKVSPVTPRPKSVTPKMSTKESTKPANVVTLVAPVTPLTPLESQLETGSGTTVLDEMCNMYLSQKTFENIRPFGDISDKLDETMYMNNLSVNELENALQPVENVSNMSEVNGNIPVIKKSMKPKKKSKLSTLNISVKMFKEQYKTAKIVKVSGLSEFE